MAFELTAQQRQAVETTGESVIVSAAAGSGKTAVLARRCAYLVCDAPTATRCDADDLLVLTFTESAAREMRERIIGELEARMAGNADDERLRQQVRLARSARISTIHSFCLWITRRWFNLLSIDPLATLLDENETHLIKLDVRDEFFERLYEKRRSSDDVLGAARIRSQDQKSGATTTGESADLATRFEQLVEEYGLGDDRAVGEFVLSLASFLDSLPAPDDWLKRAADACRRDTERVLLAYASDMMRELQWQLENARDTLEAIHAGPDVWQIQAPRLAQFVSTMEEWSNEARSAESDAATTLDQFDRIRESINKFAFSDSRRVRGPGKDHPERADYENAKSIVDDVKDSFVARLQKRFTLFSLNELRDGLAATAPYVQTIVDLTRTFRVEYGAQKRKLGVIDFSDLERNAFVLLAESGDANRPSAVARELQSRFEHVLVDEFQDINPLQEAIIRLVSREQNPQLPDNLFVVGDVKQSIYRFRLAEPSIFAQRLAALSTSTEGRAGRAIPLQQNFRSQATILAAVNQHFRKLMKPEFGGIAYDALAELRPGRSDAEDSAAPVELHVLERGNRSNQDTDDADGSEAEVQTGSDPLSAQRWDSIEREALLIGQRIRAMRAGSGDKNPPALSDIVVLLRSARHNAQKVADVLRAMGIPACADLGGSLLAAREIRDVIALLTLLDNREQDIPMAAVLRSGMAGESLTDDQLVEIRCHDRRRPFHRVVAEYAADGKRAQLREKVARILGQIDGYRVEALRRTLPDLLARIFERSGCLACVAAMPGGEQRVNNLRRLEDYAREFTSFRRQGLHRFLRFLRLIDEEERQVSTVTALGEADDVVRVMTVHQSKGLEFPIVFVAGLGTRFNLTDRAGSMLFERQVGIGLRVVDSARMIAYPSALHHRVVHEIAQTARHEELRILYVAMTRAKERLILIGSTSNADKVQAALDRPREDRPAPMLAVANAQCMLDWIVTVLAHSDPQVAGLALDDDPRIVQAAMHASADIERWRTEPATLPDTKSLIDAVAACAPLPPNEPVATDDPEVADAIERIRLTQQGTPGSSVPSVVAVSAFKGRFDYIADGEHAAPIAGPEPSIDSVEPFAIPASRYLPLDPSLPTYRGTVTHRVLEHLNFSAADASDLSREIERLIDEHLMAVADLPAVDREGIVWFLGTDLAKKIREAEAYHREFMFVAAEPPRLYDPTVGDLGDERLLVRGIVDGLILSPEGIVILDFKTDAVHGDALARRIEQYRPQVTLYARAMSRLFRKPVLETCLVFLAARHVASVAPSNIDGA